MKTILITGASSGIGYELAKLFAKGSYRVILVARNEKKLQHIKQELSRLDNKIEIIVQDLSIPNAAKHVVDQLGEGSVDILINNAGFGDYGEFKDTDMHKERNMVNLNIIALTELTKLVLPGMISRKSGKIMNVASVASFFPGPYMAVYYATKAYVLSFSEALSSELEGTGVSVTTLCPGATASGFQKAAAMTESSLVKGKKLPSSKEVAAYGYAMLMKNKVVAVHGFGNKFLVQLKRIMPRFMTRKIMKKIQK